MFPWDHRNMCALSPIRTSELLFVQWLMTARRFAIVPLMVYIAASLPNISAMVASNPRKLALTCALIVHLGIASLLTEELSP